MSLSCLRKALSAILCAALILSAFPVMALAEESGSEEPVMAAAAALSGKEISLEEEPVIVNEEEDEVPAVDAAAQEEPVEFTEEVPVAEETVVDEEVPAEVAVPNGTETISFSCTHVNPYSEDVSAGEADVTLDGASEYEIDGYCTTPAEAATVVREQMKARRTSFVFGYTTTDDPTSEYLSAILDEIVELALVHTGDPTEGDYLLWHYRWYRAYADGYYKNGEYYLNFHYTFSYYTTASQEAAVDRAITSVLNRLDVSRLNDYAKVEAVYDYICKNVRYDYSSGSNLKYSAYAAAVNGKAACQGYTLLLYRLALELGVDCRIIAGRAGGEEHRWNIARLNNAYYNLDSTWDAGETEYNCFLVSDQNLTGHTRSSYYNSAAFRSSYPVAEEDFSLDAASGTDINWDSIAWSVQNGELSVSGSGSMPDCTNPEQTPWYKESYTSVSVGNGLASVGANTFAGAGVVEATVGESVTAIGENAFSACDSLESIHILNPDCEIFDAPGTLGDPDVTTIYCYYNSTAVDYAEKHGYRYVILGYANYTIELEITTTNPAAEPTVRIYDASATDLVMYEDIRQEESSEAEHCVVSVSQETQREDGLYSRTVYLQDVEPGRYNIAAYVSDDYVMRVEYISLDDHASIGQRHMWFYGDVDNNGVVDSRDATQICRIASDLASVHGSTALKAEEELRLKAADVDRNDIIETADAQWILNYIIKFTDN